MAIPQIEKSGFVYIMSNPSMPGLIKVGRTARSPILRTKDDDLSSTGIPTPFTVEYHAWFDDMWEAEKLAHKTLWDYHHGKEFFKIDVAAAIYKIENLGIKYTRLFSKPEEDEKVKKIAQKKQEDFDKRIKKSKTLFGYAEAYRIECYKGYWDADEAIQKYDEFIKYANNLLISYPDKSLISPLQAAYTRCAAFNLNKLDTPEIEERAEIVINLVEESVKLLKKALELKPEEGETEEVEILNLIGIAYSSVQIKSNKFKKKIDSATIVEYYEKSIEYHHKAIETNPKDIDSYVILAGRYGNYTSRRKKKKAIELYRKAIELNPNKAQEYNRRIKDIES